MESGMYPLHEIAYGTLKLTDVAVRGDDVHVDGEYVGTYTFEFVVCVDVVNGEPASVIQAEDGLRLTKDSGFRSSWNLGHSAKTDLTGDGV